MVVTDGGGDPCHQDFNAGNNLEKSVACNFLPGTLRSFAGYYMRMQDEILALQQQLREHSLTRDEALESRYTMQRPTRPPGLVWQLRWLAGRVVRWLNSKGLPGNDPWPVSLKHSSTSAKAQPLIVWGPDSNVDKLRESCDNLSETLANIPGYAPVLITEVADFGYYSRLGWLIEYLPDLSGSGDCFKTRKLRLLARLYRGAPAVPVQIGLLPKRERTEILQEFLN